MMTTARARARPRRLLDAAGRCWTLLDAAGRCWTLLVLRLQLLDLIYFEMPGRGTTIKHCVFCHAPLNIACKVCKFCKAEQPYKLRLKKKVEKFDLKSKVWLQSHKKNHTASHVKDEASILLEKLHVLGIRAVLFMSRPGRKPNTWVSENVLPRSQLTEASTACLRRMQSLFDIVIQGWTVRAPEVLQTSHPAAVEDEDPAPSTGQPPAAVEDEDPAPSTVQPPAAVEAEDPAPSTGQPPAAVMMGVTAAGPLPPAAQGRAAGALPAGCPANENRPKKRKKNKDSAENGKRVAKKQPRRSEIKECLHTVEGNLEFYPVKSLVRCRIVKGQKMKQVEWEPCSLCGKKWPLEWVLDTDTC